MGQLRPVVHRAQPIDDIPNPQPGSKRRDHRQRPQRLLHRRHRPVPRTLSHNPGTLPPNPAPANPPRRNLPTITDVRNAGLGSADLSEQEEADAARAFVAFQHLLADHVRRRHATAAGDLISDVVAALGVGVGPLTFDQEAELVGTISSTFGASHITTTDTIGNALRMLLGHPKQWQLLRRRPDLITNAVEETLRFEAPVPTIFRRATRAATLAGVDLPQGADVLLVFASANRDEDRYPDADRFEVTRTPTRHFGFGAGVHTCVGAAPARTQARIALRTLVERLPSLRLAPDQGIPIRRSINVRGPLALELHW